MKKKKLILPQKLILEGTAALILPSNHENHFRNNVYYSIGFFERCILVYLAMHFIDIFISFFNCIFKFQSRFYFHQISIIFCLKE